MRLLLPSAGVAVALVLLILGSKEAPTVQQDFPPFVAPAIGVCEGINAPATVLLGGLMLLMHSIHLEQALSRLPIPQIVPLTAVALLWFVVAIEVDLRLAKRVSAAHRVAAAGLALAITVVLVPFGIETWRQGQTALAFGCGAWSAVLTFFYTIDLIRLAASRIKAR